MVHSVPRLSGEGCHEAVLWVLMWEGPHTASKPTAAAPEVEYRKRLTPD